MPLAAFGDISRRTNIVLMRFYDIHDSWAKILSPGAFPLGYRAGQLFVCVAAALFSSRRGLCRLRMAFDYAFVTSRWG